MTNKVDTFSRRFLKYNLPTLRATALPTANSTSLNNFSYCLSFE
jgi:hypothetical protein